MAKKPVKYIQGKYKPRHPEKYRGNIKDICYRSSFELEFMNWCDNTPSIIEWASEEVAIPYLKPTDNRIHTYYLDFWIKYISNDYEKDDDYWKLVKENEYSEKEQVQIKKIKEGNSTIVPIMGDIEPPNPSIGKKNTLYLCKKTNNLYIKTEGAYKLDKNGNKIKIIKKCLIEIKPYDQTLEPKLQQRITASYKKKVMNYIINEAKWKYATAFAEKNGMEFKVLTEKWLLNKK
jgi:hypothetical protein